MLSRQRRCKLLASIVCVVVTSLTWTSFAFPRSEASQGVSISEKRATAEAQRLREHAESLSSFIEERKILHRAVESLSELYWEVGGGFESQLMLNNTFIRAIETTPVVYTSSNNRIPAETITGILHAPTTSARAVATRTSRQRKARSKLKPIRRDSSRENRMTPNTGVSITGDKIICPQCKGVTHLLRIDKAARLVDVSRRSIYNYVEDGSVYAVRVAGKTLRVCESCLLGTASQI